MKRTMIFRFMVVCSLVLNAVFVAMWLTHAAPRFLVAKQLCGTENGACKKCPLYETLALSDSQWVVLRPHVEAYRRVADSLRREIATARESLLTELSITPTDSSALAACRMRILDGQRKMQEQVVLTVLEQKAVLMPEQQRRFIETLRSGMACEGGLGMMGLRQTSSRKEDGDKNCLKR